MEVDPTNSPAASPAMGMYITNGGATSIVGVVATPSAEVASAAMYGGGSNSRATDTIPSAVAGGDATEMDISVLTTALPVTNSVDAAKQQTRRMLTNHTMELMASTGFDCTIVDIPRRASLIVGSRAMIADDEGLGVLPDMTNFRCYIIRHHLTTRLGWLPSVIARLLADPINVISWYGGLEPAYDVLRELGFKINIYLSIENFKMTKETVRQRVPAIVHCSVEDARAVTKECLPQVEWLAVLGTPPCQLSSRRTALPVHDTSLFQFMSKVMAEVIEAQDNIPHTLYENVVPHSELTKIQGEWNQIFGMEAQFHNAIDSGSICNQPRLYWCNSVSWVANPPMFQGASNACLTAQSIGSGARGMEMTIFDPTSGVIQCPFGCLNLHMCQTPCFGWHCLGRLYWWHRSTSSRFQG